jgi:alkanesulfonate monooxygenase SsuD/methylene tetrahydromethanopterin reductase-like flavin-dependent oxidoreductase (luciferase family)
VASWLAEQTLLVTTSISTSRGPRLVLHLDPSLSVGEMVTRAQQAEAAGFDGVYGIEGLRDVFVPMAAIAAATTRLQLGTYVANAYARTPQSAATAALQVDELAGGRFVLGIGSGNRFINDWFFGLDSSKPMQKLREYLAVLGALLSGERPDGTAVGGDIHHVQSRFVRPVPRRVPVVLAAAGPRMIELAAAATDGVGLGILVSAEHLAHDIRPRALAAADAAGRDPDALRFPMAAMVNVDDDVERARALTRRAICGLFHPIPHPYYDFLLRAQGYGAVADAATELAPQQRWNEAMEQIDDELIDRLTITGTPEQCASRLATYSGVADEIICLQLARAAEPGSDGGDALFRMVAIARERHRASA